MHSEISFLLTFPNLRSGRARLSHQHTSSCSLVRRQQKQTDRRVTLCFFLTGPHTFTADSPFTQGSLSTISGVPDPQVHGAVKASVPKLLSCPGASASSPLREALGGTLPLGSSENLQHRLLALPFAPGLHAGDSLPHAQSITLAPATACGQGCLRQCLCSYPPQHIGAQKKGCSQGCSLDRGQIFSVWVGWNQKRPSVSDLSIGKAAPMPR